MTSDTSMSPDELAALYLAGALDAQQEAAFRARLDDGWPEGRAALALLEPAVPNLVGHVRPVAPPVHVKQSLLSKISTPTNQSDELAGITFRFKDEATFRTTRFPGVSFRLLNLDKERGQFTALMRLEPGAKYPEHHHDGVEECIVLEGSILVGNVRMHAGDYQRAEPHSDHVEQWSDTGALLYINAPVSLLKV